jgi:probable HAF family extracellular repeat protein
MSKTAWQIIVCAIAVATGAPAPAATFRGLGDLPGGSFTSGANGVSADGCIVVGMSTSGQGSEAFRWDRRGGGGMVGLGDLAGGTNSSSAWAASADGTVIVGTSGSASGLEAFRWTAATGMVSLGDLAGGPFFSVANSVSADGRVVAGYGHSASGQEAFHWTAASGIRGLGDLAGGTFESAAAGISADGTVIVGIGASDAGNQAIRWTQAEGMTGLGDLSGGAFFSGANGVSADGTVVVGNDYSELPGQAFLWHAPDGMNGLGFLPGADLTPWSEALDVSAVGYRVAGFSGTAITGSVATVWDPANGMRRVDEILAAEGVGISGWRLVEATGISDNGRIVVGRGVNPQGKQEAWLALLPGSSPDPSIPGDANLDGTVDRRDLAIVVEHFGATCGATFEQGDFDGDGGVSMMDLLIVKRQFGDPGAPGGAAAGTATGPAGVPEPATVWLALAFAAIGATIFGRWCKKAQSRGPTISPGETAAIRARVRRIA